MLNLPKNVTAKNYAGDKIITGPNMTATTYNNIKATMKPEDRKQVIGWTRMGR